MKSITTIIFAALLAGAAFWVASPAQARLSYNGLNANGLNANGLNANGSSMNGMSVNGLTVRHVELPSDRNDAETRTEDAPSPNAGK